MVAELDDIGVEEKLAVGEEVRPEFETEFDNVKDEMLIVFVVVRTCSDEVCEVIVVSINAVTVVDMG